MIEKAASAGHGELDALILRALVRKLVANGQQTLIRVNRPEQ